MVEMIAVTKITLMEPAAQPNPLLLKTATIGLTSWVRLLVGTRGSRTAITEQYSPISTITV